MNVAPYGSWPSPVSVEDLTAGSIGLSALAIDGGELYWLESRADQGGRASLWRRSITGGEPIELTPSPTYVRTAVHEYGGGDFAVDAGVVVYSDYHSAQVHVLRDGLPAAPITPEGAWRFGDLRLHADRELVLAVREDHTGDGEPVSTIVALDLNGDNPQAGDIWCSGADFYSDPELSATGRLAWTEWDHPNMPWDSTTIRVGEIVDGLLSSVIPVAGEPGESALAPRWLGEELIFISDRTQWWNLYRWVEGDVMPLYATEAEFCLPQWQLGQQPYVVLDDHRLLTSINRGNSQALAILDLDTFELTPVPGDHVRVDGLAVHGGQLAAILGFPDRPAALAILDLDQLTWTTVRVSSELSIDPASLSTAQQVSWSGPQGEVYGWFYPPANAEYTAPKDTSPVLITVAHGGPTAGSQPDLRIGYQFWTTRGYAILDVNYGGSTGYGRAYRDRLLGNWGVVDVRDCADGASAMGEQGLADPDRLVIRGGSAGGYTTLGALTTTDVFAAGISLYGVGDLELLVSDTHKFESRYLDNLVGPYPQELELYRARSPIHHTDALSSPILVLQGLDDKVVPPNQARAIAEAARTKGLPVALVMFEGEGHGFRAAETITASIQAQISFLSRILGFEPADDVPTIPIDNVD